VHAPQDPTDERLLQAVARGEQIALEQLYARWAPRLAYVMRGAGVAHDDVPDLLQMVFLEVWAKAKRFQPERGGAAGWLFQLARSRTIDFLRRRRRFEPLEDSEATADSTWQDGEHLTLRGALATLRPRERAVLELAYFGGFTLREISEAWGVPLGTVKTWGHRGLQKLRQCLAEGEAQAGKSPLP